MRLRHVYTAGIFSAFSDPWLGNSNGRGGGNSPLPACPYAQTSVVPSEAPVPDRGQRQESLEEVLDPGPRKWEATRGNGKMNPG